MAGGRTLTDPAHRAGVPGIAGWHYPVTLFAGILLWMVHLAGGMALVGISCQLASVWPIHVLTVATAVPTILAGLLGWRIQRAASRAESADGARLLGWLGVMLNLASLVLILAEAVPLFFLDACVG